MEGAAVTPTRKVLRESLRLLEQREKEDQAKFP